MKNNNNLYFQVDILDMSERMDVEFYRPQMALSEYKVSQKAGGHILSDYILSMNGGATPKLSDNDAYDLTKGSVPFVRVQNLTKLGYLNIDSCKEISKGIHNGMLARSQVHGGDLLVKITGVGRMAVASIAPEGFEGNINQHVVVIKTQNKKISEYLCDYLNLDIIETIAKRHSTGGVRPALDYTSLKNMPLVEGIDFTNLRNAKLEILKAEKKCLILDKELQNYQRKLFYIKGKKNSYDDLFYYQHFLDILCDSWVPSKMAGSEPASALVSFSLIDICYLRKGQSITSKDVAEGEYDVIGGGQTSPYSSKTYNTKPGSITISASGANAGYVWYHDKPIFASDCIVVISKDETSFLTRYVCEVLMAYQERIYSLQRGAGQPHVYISDISKLQIPYMPLDKQKQVIMEIDKRKSEMKSIRDKAYQQYDGACDEINRYLLS